MTDQEYELLPPAMFTDLATEYVLTFGVPIKSEERKDQITRKLSWILGMIPVWEGDRTVHMIKMTEDELLPVSLLTDCENAYLLTFAYPIEGEEQIQQINRKLSWVFGMLAEWKDDRTVFLFKLSAEKTD